MEEHQKYIKRCIQLAANGLGTTNPNPLVGSVIVSEGKIIGEGWHLKPGEPHAEVHAINSVRDKSKLSKATLYVNLEPCSHFGRTPPCCDLIIRSGIKNVIVGTVDPNELVAGNGIRKLREAGISVTSDICEEECLDLNRRFFTFHTKKRPYIILKWAQSQNGLIAPSEKLENKPIWISNQFSRQLVHKWRSEEHAILIGTQTAIDDNPALTVRDWAGNNPIRIVLDRNNRIPKENHIFDSQAQTIAVKEIRSDSEIGIETIDFSTKIAIQIAQVLHKRGVVSVIIEGGRKTLQTFIDENLWDEARVFESEVFISDGIKAPLLPTGASRINNIAGDKLLMFRNNGQHNNI
ncbi:MAG TPA: bifunctional diaminohydroxyphosphoribosylaminopyrimidine deaminase/5-amino-6-(5-phosphoribosylamino)uracil reductase RibD [Flavobacterium sp.]